MDIAINKAECIAKTIHFGFFRYTDICTGAVRTDVPWGAVDWAMHGSLAALIAFFVFGLVTIAVLIFREIGR